MAINNLLICPGQYAIASAGGSDMKIMENEVYSPQTEISNVGIYIWPQKVSSCRNIQVLNNSVDWTNKHGKKNPWWLGSGCENIRVDGNNFKWVYPGKKRVPSEPIPIPKVPEQYIVERRATFTYEAGELRNISFK